mmetsp:Transcript_19700/g.17411  ORF Transcript_19700/g.17411 Transcript_19700/m.17411 type:complete len:92 (-) Transcript_19700:39-314(-)
MYKIIDALASIFKLIKEKDDEESDGSEQNNKIESLIKDRVGIKLQEGPFKMWIDAIKELVKHTTDDSFKNTNKEQALSNKLSIEKEDEITK